MPSNPTSDWTVAYDATNEDFYILTPNGPHTSNIRFDDADEAYEYIDEMNDRWERDYDDYLEENRYAIRQSELYEQWRNEY